VKGRGVLLALAIVVVAFLGLFWLGAPSTDAPLDPRSHEPGGTSALVALLRELGASVEIDTERPGPDTDVALLMEDRLDDSARAELQDWVDAGGVLVVSDPSSPLTPQLAGLAGQLGGATGAGGGSVEIEADVCDFDPLDEGLDTVTLFGGPALYEVGPDDDSCFGDGDAAYVVATERGEGTVVGLGGSGILVNRSLDEQDNAPVAAALLAPREGTRVEVLDPTVPAAPGDGESLSDLVPDGVWRLLVQLGVAFLLYALWRSRRLGQPVDEPQPVKVAGSELVSAVGGLLERSKSPQHAADVLRAELQRDLTVHLGLPPGTPPEQLAQMVTARTGLDQARVQAALGPGPVADGDALLAVVRLIDYVRKEVLEHVGA
jgi:hypothetical protein